jgi:hypothetical protein
VLAAFLPERGFAMRGCVDMDPKQAKQSFKRSGETARVPERGGTPGEPWNAMRPARRIEEQSPSTIRDKRRR